MTEPTAPSQRKRRIVYRVHAVQRMAERGISEEDVAEVIATGKAIEEYANDWPYSGKLTLGWLKNRPIHMVFAVSGHEISVIAVHGSDFINWEPGFEVRKP